MKPLVQSLAQHWPMPVVPALGVQGLPEQEESLTQRTKQKPCYNTQAMWLLCYIKKTVIKSLYVYNIDATTESGKDSVQL